MTPDIADIIAGELKVSRGTAYDMMREALAEQQEPVEWIEPAPDFYISELSRNTIRFHNAVHGRQEFNKKALNECTVPVWFTLPPAQRKPLTDAQLEKGRDQTFSINNPFCPCDSKTFRKVARWVESAHGIKE